MKNTLGPALARTLKMLGVYYGGGRVPVTGAEGRRVTHPPVLTLDLASATPSPPFGELT